jgi:DnaJ-class molecular chaperone
MEGYNTCEKCNGRGVLLNTLRNHWIGNAKCLSPGKCKNVTIDICKWCYGEGKILWIDRVIVKKKNILYCQQDQVQRIFGQLKEILEFSNISSSGDMPGALTITFKNPKK